MRGLRFRSTHRDKRPRPHGEQARKPRVVRMPIAPHLNRCLRIRSLVQGNHPPRWAQSACRSLRRAAWGRNRLAAVDPAGRGSTAPRANTVEGSTAPGVAGTTGPEQQGRLLCRLACTSSKTTTSGSSHQADPGRRVPQHAFCNTLVRVNRARRPRARRAGRSRHTESGPAPAPTEPPGYGGHRRRNRPRRCGTGPARPG
jgi:hypothetical protein